MPFKDITRRRQYHRDYKRELAAKAEIDVALVGNSQVAQAEETREQTRCKYWYTCVNCGIRFRPRVGSRGKFHNAECAKESKRTDPTFSKSKEKHTVIRYYTKPEDVGLTPTVQDDELPRSVRLNELPVRQSENEELDLARKLIIRTDQSRVRKQKIEELEQKYSTKLKGLEEVLTEERLKNNEIDQTVKRVIGESNEKSTQLKSAEEKILGLEERNKKHQENVWKQDEPEKLPILKLRITQLTEIYRIQEGIITDLRKDKQLLSKQLESISAKTSSDKSFWRR